MTLRIGDAAPDLDVNTTEGPIRLHGWFGDSWAVLFSHPKDFTPVCTTELGCMARMKPEFDKRNTRILGLSVDPVSDYARWLQDIEDVTGHRPNYPLIGDEYLRLAKRYGMLPAEADPAKGRTAADNQTVRNMFVIGPDKKIKLILSYPMGTGRNFDEILRVLDSLQLSQKHPVATPANWHQGEDVIIVPWLKDEAAKEKFPGGWKTLKPCLRVVAQPKR